MTLAFAIFLVIHGLIHLFGFAKAFGLAELPQLHQNISLLAGVLWLIAAALFVAAAACLFLWPRAFWVIGALAIGVSFIVIAPSWSDAKLGAVANALAGIGVLFGFLTSGRFSLRGQFDRDVDRALTRTPSVGRV